MQFNDLSLQDVCTQLETLVCYQWDEMVGQRTTNPQNESLPFLHRVLAGQGFRILTATDSNVPGYHTQGIRRVK